MFISSSVTSYCFSITISIIFIVSLKVSTKDFESFTIFRICAIRLSIFMSVYASSSLMRKAILSILCNTISECLIYSVFLLFTLIDSMLSISECNNLTNADISSSFFAISCFEITPTRKIPPTKKTKAIIVQAFKCLNACILKTTNAKKIVKDNRTIVKIILLLILLLIFFLRSCVQYSLYRTCPSQPCKNTGGWSFWLG